MSRACKIRGWTESTAAEPKPDKEKQRTTYHYLSRQILFCLLGLIVSSFYMSTAQTPDVKDQKVLVLCVCKLDLGHTHLAHVLKCVVIHYYYLQAECSIPEAGLQNTPR